MKLRFFPLSRLGVAAALLMATATALPARADEFATLPPGDPAYSELSTLAHAGWLDDVDSRPESRNSTKEVALTRYEISLQVARTIISVTARAEANPSWPVPKVPLRALIELSNSFQVELKGMGVDGLVARGRLEALYRGVSAKTSSVTEESKPLAAPRGDRDVAPASVPAPPQSEDAALRHLSISQRLRVTTAISVLARDANDIFGDAAFGPNAGLARKGPTYVTGAEPLRTGVAVGLTDWLTLHANYASMHQTGPSAMPSLLDGGARFGLGNDMRSLRAGVDLNLPANMVVSGNVENVDGTESGASSLTRYSGDVGWTGWQNRLSLKANMSRLIPDDARVLPATLVGLNFGLDVSERLSLTLQYQKMFTAPDTADPSRLVAGGVSLNF